jgi:hypothetical protein
MTLRIGVSTMLADCNIDLGHDDEKHAEESLTPNLQTSRWKGWAWGADSCRHVSICGWHVAWPALSLRVHPTTKVPVFLSRASTPEQRIDQVTRLT